MIDLRTAAFNELIDSNRDSENKNEKFFFTAFSVTEIRQRSSVAEIW